MAQLARVLREKRWLICWYGADGQLKDGLERWAKRKPVRYAATRCAAGETFGITEVLPHG